MHRYGLAIAASKIRHRRYLPKSHEFSAQLNYLCFDPDQIHSYSQKSWLWSTQGWNVLAIKDQDFLTMESGNIREKVQHILYQKKDFELTNEMQIRVLALPRSLGFRFNSVVFYMVFDLHQQPRFVLSEITNTPWNERIVYVHDCHANAVNTPLDNAFNDSPSSLQRNAFSDSSNNSVNNSPNNRINIQPNIPANNPAQHGSYQSHQFDFKKEFHVSPFMPMDLDYRWQFSFSDHQNVIHMQLFQKGVLQFDATMRFSLQPITLPSQQRHYAISSVLEPFKMVMGIYLNAFRLWKKKIPFYRHPKKENGKSKL